MSIKERAGKLDVRKDYETGKRIAFTVLDGDTGTLHSVFYSKEAKKWDCDCIWHSTKYEATKKYCAHITAAKEKSGLK